MFDTDGAIYMGSQRDPAGCRVGLFGVPYDGCLLYTSPSPRDRG